MALTSTALTVAALASTVISAAGTIYTGISQARASRKQGEIDDQRAAAEREVARMEAINFRRKQSRTLATLRTGGAASGIEAEGSQLLVSDAAVRDIELGAATIITGGETRATRLEQQADISRARGRSALIGSGFQAAGTILSSASSYDFGT